MSESELFFQFISEPQEVNFGGKVHGGAVMKWIDRAGYACASNWAGNYCVTVYVGGIHFIRPVLIGALVRVEAKIVYTGRTSIHIAVDVKSRNITEDKFVKTSHCIIVFVAVDENHNPTPVPNWIPQTEEQKKMESYAIKLMNLRKGINEGMTSFLEI